MLALVVGLAPFGQRQFDLRAAAAVEIDGKGHERHALAGDGAMQLRDLALMKEQLARALGLMVEAVAVTEFGYVGVDQPDLLLLHLGIARSDALRAGNESGHTWISRCSPCIYKNKTEPYIILVQKKII